MKAHLIYLKILTFHCRPRSCCLGMDDIFWMYIAVWQLRFHSKTLLHLISCQLFNPRSIHFCTIFIKQKPFGMGRCIRAVGTNQRAPQARVLRGICGYPSQENFEKLNCLRQHLVHLEGHFIGSKAVKSEYKNVNESGTYNCNRIIYNLDNKNREILLKILLKKYFE